MNSGGMVALRNATVSISAILREFLISPDLKRWFEWNERQVFRANIIEVSTETRYYVASYLETASSLWSTNSEVIGALRTRFTMSEMWLRAKMLLELAPRHWFKFGPLRGMFPSIYIVILGLVIWPAQRLASFSLNTPKLLFRMK
jgi:hypothetical protein